VLIAASSARREQLACTIAAAAPVKLTVLQSGIFLEHNNARIAASGADVVLADIVLADFDASESAAAALRWTRLIEDLPEDVGVVLLADNPSPRWVRSAIRAGANAVLARDATKEELHLALLAAESNMVLLHRGAALGIFPSVIAIQRARDLDGPVEQLTEREREILGLVSDGLGNREIARKLKISDHTVKFHVSSILGKLGAASRAEAVSQGIRRGLIAL
jgi:NarL family two-component system response regulator YdfI